MLSIPRKRWCKHRLSGRKVDCHSHSKHIISSIPIDSIQWATVEMVMENTGLSVLRAQDPVRQATLRLDNRCLDHRFRGIESIIEKC